MFCDLILYFLLVFWCLTRGFTLTKGNTVTNMGQCTMEQENSLWRGFEAAGKPWCLSSWVSLGRVVLVPSASWQSQSGVFGHFANEQGDYGRSCNSTREQCLSKGFTELAIAFSFITIYSIFYGCLYVCFHCHLLPGLDGIFLTRKESALLQHHHDKLRTEKKGKLSSHTAHIVHGWRVQLSQCPII